MAPIQQRQREIILSYINAYNHFDVPGMLTHLDKAIVFENIADGKVNLRTEGIDAFRQQAEAATQYFTKRTQTIDAIVFKANNKVVVDIQYEATLAIDLPNGLKAGDSLMLRGQSVFEFDGEKLLVITDIS